VNRTKTVPYTEMSMPLNTEVNWSGGMSFDRGPVFRQLPHADGFGSSADPRTGERRSAVRRDMELGVEIYGYDRQLSLIHAYGTTQDVSASGLLANVDVDLPIGSRAVIAVQPSEPSLQQSILRGRVVRCHENSDGYGLAIHFDLDARQFVFDAA